MSPVPPELFDPSERRREPGKTGYYERRIREIREGVRRPGGRSFSLAELERLAGERAATRARRS